MVHRFVPLVRVTVDVDDLKTSQARIDPAAHGFDPTADVFESYARRIRGHPDEIRKSQPLSRTVYSRRKELENTMETLRMELNRQPEEEEIADRLGHRERYRAQLDELRPVVFVPLHQMLDGDDEFLIPTIITRRTLPKRTRRKHGAPRVARADSRTHQQLNRKQQQVLLLFHYEGLRMKDVAQASVNHVCARSIPRRYCLAQYLQRQERI